MTPPLWQKVKRNWMKAKSKSKRGEWKAGLKLNIQKTKIMASSPITSWQIDGETMETVTDLIFLGAIITADGDCSHEIQRRLLLGRKATTKPRQHIKKQRYYFANKGPYSQSYGFFSSHVWMWELDHREDWEQKNWCFWIGVLEKTLETSLDCNEIKPVNLKRNQLWIFIERTDAKAETPILWPPNVKNWIGKDPDAEKDWRREKKRMTEDETVGCHHWLNGHEFEQAPVDGEGQGSLACCVHGVTKSWTWLSDWTTTI